MKVMQKRGIDERVAEEQNLIGALYAARMLYGTHVAQLYKEAGRYSGRRTLAELLTESERIAEGLIALGLEEGGRVGILAENGPEWNMLDIATLMNRSATVGFYTNDSPADIAYKIEDANVRFIAVDCEEQLQKIRALPKSVQTSLRAVLLFGSLEKKSEQEIHLTQIAVSPDKVKQRIERLQSNDWAKIVYTSGTSGKPKGAILTHRNLLSNVCMASHCVVIDQENLLISYLPDAHIFQAFLDFAAWLNGAALAYSHRKTLKEDLPLIRPHFFPGVPKVYSMLLSSIAQKVSELSQGTIDLMSESFQKEQFAPMIKASAGLDQVQFYVSGAAKLDPQVAQTLEEKLDIVVHEGYGLSETSPVIATNTPEARRLGTVGQPIPGVSVRIVNEDRCDLPPCEKGEIAVRGDNVFQGYLNKKEATEKVLSDQWFYTGDRGSLDADGYLTVYGRMGHRVKFANGEYHDLEEIGARFLTGAKLIGQIAVAGEQREYGIALITLSEDLQAAQALAQKLQIPHTDPRELIYHEKIVQAVREEFEALRKAHSAKNPHERVEKAIYLRPFSADNQETTPTQKIRIRYILDKYEKHIAALYASKATFQVLQCP